MYYVLLEPKLSNFGEQNLNSFKHIAAVGRRRITSTYWVVDCEPRSALVAPLDFVCELLAIASKYSRPSPTVIVGEHSGVHV
jgi:hypothetical protein